MTLTRQQAASELMEGREMEVYAIFGIWYFTGFMFGVRHLCWTWEAMPMFVLATALGPLAWVVNWIVDNR
jgi:hypothetical protein